MRHPASYHLLAERQPCRIDALEKGSVVSHVVAAELCRLLAQVLGQHGLETNG